MFPLPHLFSLANISQVQIVLCVAQSMVVPDWPLQRYWRIVIGAATVVVRSRRAPAATKRMNNALSEEERRRLAELLKEEEKQ